MRGCSDRVGRFPIAGRRAALRKLVAGLPLLLAMSLTAARGTAAELPGEPYRVGSGDRLQVFVWKEADLSRELIVRTDGMVTVPLVGDVQASGLTTAELASVIQQKLGRFVTSPNVTVSIAGALSAQVYVVGRVAKPGAYPLDRPTTFLQALALAGGVAEFAKTDRILIFRTGGRVITVNYKKLESAGDASENVKLVAGDTVLVP
jgi:polysaccharide export outer membrane protein